MFIQRQLQKNLAILKVETIPFFRFIMQSPFIQRCRGVNKFSNINTCYTVQHI